MKIKVDKPKARSWLAVVAKLRSGAGRHKDSKTYTRKVKHRGRTEDRR